MRPYLRDEQMQREQYEDKVREAKREAEGCKMCDRPLDCEDEELCEQCLTDYERQTWDDYNEYISSNIFYNADDVYSPDPSDPNTPW